ncbi:MAG: hypothetical protein ABEH43_02310, partial [Flavobacteriales bacterium]
NDELKITEEFRAKLKNYLSDQGKNISSINGKDWRINSLMINSDSYEGFLEEIESYIKDWGEPLDEAIKNLKKSLKSQDK